MASLRRVTAPRHSETTSAGEVESPVEASRHPFVPPTRLSFLVATPTDTLFPFLSVSGVFPEVVFFFPTRETSSCSSRWSVLL